MTSPSKHRQIWKYAFEEKDGPQPKRIPRDAVVVHVAAQFAKICAWVIVNPENDVETRRFVVHGTGHNALPMEKYLGSAHINQFVWHLFEDLP